MKNGDNITQTDFLKKYIGVLSREQFDKIEDQILNPLLTVTFSDQEVADLDKRLAEKKQKEDALAMIVDNNYKGTLAESEGNIPLAQTFYEKNILINYRATFSFDRLMVLYRKEKKFDDEMRVINRAREVFNEQFDKNYLIKLNLRHVRIEQLKIKLQEKNNIKDEK